MEPEKTKKPTKKKAAVKKAEPVETVEVAEPVEVVEVAEPVETVEVAEPVEVVEVAEPVFKIAPGKSLTSKKGILGPGTVVKVAHFAGGESTFIRLLKSGHVVKA